MKVKFSEIDEALFFTGDGSENLAYLCTETGDFFYKSDYVDEEEPLPDDLEENEKFILLPSRNDLNLAHPKDFVSDKMPDHYEKCNEIFSRKGAYRRFKDWLIDIERIEDWHDYEAKISEKSLREWCKENKITLMD